MKPERTTSYRPLHPSLALLALIEKIEEFNKQETETQIEDGLSICPHIIQEAPNES